MQLFPVTFESGALNRRLTYYVFLPPGYEREKERRYPVLYLLHGRYDSETAWPYKGSAHQTLQQMMDAGELAEMVVIMPSDGGYDRGTYYMNWYNGDGRFEDYFLFDLIPHVDRTYRTLADREHRMIAGLSMGGYGSLLLSLRNPHLFGAAGSMSGALGMMPSVENLHLAPDWTHMEIVRLAGPLNGPYAREHNLAWLAERAVSQGLYPAVYFDCGREDFLYEANQWLKGQWEASGFPFTYQEFPGVHSWEYWTEHLKDVLRFMNGYLASLPSAK